jgi:hypothetical protein
MVHLHQDGEEQAADQARHARIIILGPVQPVQRVQGAHRQLGVGRVDQH